MLAAALVVVSLFPGPTEAAREQARRIAEREGLQTSLVYDARESAERPGSATPRPRRTDGRVQEPRRTTRAAPDASPGDGAAGASGWAKTVLVVLGVVLLASLLTGLVAALRRPPSPATTSGSGGPAGAASSTVLPPSVLDPAAALAQEGRFAEAVHRLLLDALGVLAARQRIPRHATSREVLGLLALDPPDRDALVRLVELVEISHFGGRPLDESAWRAAYAAFSTLGRRGAGPA